MAKVNQRLWQIPGQRAKRKAWGYTAQVVEDGKRVQKRVYKSEWTKEDAEQALAALLLGVEEAKPAAPADGPSLNEYADKWLINIEGYVARKTKMSYDDNLRLHIRPTLGATPLAAITRAMVKELLGAKRASGLGKNTVRLIRATLSVMFNDAIEDGLLTTNAAAGVGKGSRRVAGTVTQNDRRQSIRPLTVEQLQAFLAALDAGPRREAILFLTLADAGLRPGEALALKWDDVDTQGRTIRVSRAVSEGEVKGTKSGTIRDVDLTVRLAAALEAWQAAQEADALVSGTDPSPWVFPEGAGILDADGASRRFRSALRRAGLPRFRLYDLRHTYASHLLAEGAPLPYVAAQLGHAKPTTTLAHYAHFLPRGDRAWADRLEAARSADSARFNARASKVATGRQTV